MAGEGTGDEDPRADRSIRAPLEGEVLPPQPEPKPGDEARVRAGFWRTAKKAARQIPFTQDLVAAYYCALDPQVPLRVRATLLAALAYFVTPFDFVPDILAGIGFGDDATVLIAAMTMVATHISPRHREQARQALDD